MMIMMCQSIPHSKVLDDTLGIVASEIQVVFFLLIIFAFQYSKELEQKYS